MLLTYCFASLQALWTNLLLFSPEKFAPALLPAAVAFVATAVAVFPARWLSLQVGAMAEPGDRRIHSRPTARLGGLALYAGFGLAAAFFSTHPKTLAVLLGAAMITAIMAFDDLHGLRPVVKLGAQTMVSLIAILGFGIAIEFVAIPGLGVAQLGWLSIPLTLFWFVGLQNTINLLDGVDGLAAGVVAIVAGAILLAAINLLKPEIVVLAGALIGACLGFLLFNWHPARVFMGDAGSHFLGFTLAALAVLSVAKATVVFALAVPIAALAIPIVDTVWAIIRRRLRGQSIGTADAEHLHHRLLDFGLSPRETALIFYFGTAIFAAIGLTIYGHRTILLGAMVLMLVGIVVIMVRRLRRIGR